MATTEFSYSIDSIKPVFKDGKTDYLLAVVKLNVRCDGHHQTGDNIHVHLRLPDGSERLDFETLQDRAATEALRLLSDASDLRLEDAQ